MGDTHQFLTELGKAMRVTGFSVKDFKQAQKEEQPKKAAPRKRKLDSLSDWPGFQAVKR